MSGSVLKPYRTWLRFYLSCGGIDKVVEGWFFVLGPVQCLFYPTSNSDFKHLSNLDLDSQFGDCFGSGSSFGSHQKKIHLVLS